MKKSRRIGLMIGAALLQIIYFGNLQSAAGQIATTAPTNNVLPASISPAVAEVARLAQSGATDDVLVAFAKKSQRHFELSEETITYLKDLGLAPEVITAMIEHDGAFLPESSAPDRSTQPAPTLNPAGSDIPETVSAEYVSNAPAEVNYFYAQLSPYGTWASIEGVGWCWQPHCYSFRRDWRPYCHGGRWVYTNCGWYWQSDYSWGWAPFHYGRWQHHPRSGWVWCPGREWGPAWVTWRVSNGHCGWAPLPPHTVYVAGAGWRHRGVHYKDDCDFGLESHHFTFVATKDFTSRELGRHHLPETEARNVFQGTTVINGTMAANNRVLMNHGLPVEKVSAMTHTEIRKVAIQDAASAAGRMNAPQRGALNGSVVYRYGLQAPSQPLNPVAQRVTENHSALLHPAIAPRPIQSAQGPQPTRPANQGGRPARGQSNRQNTP